METPPKFLMFQEAKKPKKPFVFQETELPFISGKVYSEPSHIRTGNIFRTLTYLKPQTYSEHYQTGRMEFFSKTAA